VPASCGGCSDRALRANPTSALSLPRLESKRTCSGEDENWESFVFVNPDPKAESFTDFLGGLVKRVVPLGLNKLHYFDRRVYDIHCNWKVFIDNYLDGGYHVPHLHKGLNSVLDYREYTIENEDRYCLQSSPLVSSNEDAATGATRKGDRAWVVGYFEFPHLPSLKVAHYPRLVLLAISQSNDQLLRRLYGYQPGAARRCRPL